MGLLFLKKIYSVLHINRSNVLKELIPCYDVFVILLAEFHALINIILMIVFSLFSINVLYTFYKFSKTCIKRPSKLEPLWLSKTCDCLMQDKRHSEKCFSKDFSVFIHWLLNELLLQCIAQLPFQHFDMVSQYWFECISSENEFHARTIVKDLWK